MQDADPPSRQANNRDEAWRHERQLGKVARRAFTDTLQQHDAIHDVAACTDEVYLGGLGRRAAELRRRYGISRSQPLRDRFDVKQLAVTTVIEAVSADRIRETGCRGGDCRAAVTRVGAILGAALKAEQADRAPPPSAANDAHGDKAA